MQSKRERLGYEMTLLPSLEALVPADHQLRRLDKVLDLGFVHEAVRDKYCQDNGRPSIDPEVVIRLFLLQALYGYESVRRLMREVQVNLAYRWFIGYGLEESLPDHSTLSKALDRFGDAVFDALFTRSVSQCQASGLIEGKVLHVDATTIRADLDAGRAKQADPPDPDARFGRFPDGKVRPGYKQHTVADGKHRVVLEVSVTPANVPEHDEAVELVDRALGRLPQPPEAVCADGAYGSGKNAYAFEQRGIRFVTPPPKGVTYTGVRYFSIEQFTYDEGHDEFVCPHGKRLRYAGTEQERGRRTYRARRSDCRACPLKSQCTSSQRRHLKVTRYHASLVRLRADSKTASFKTLYRSRAPVIEGVFAESKQWHGLRRARWRSLSKTLVQCLMVATVINLKRLMAAGGPLPALLTLWRHLRLALRRLWTFSDTHVATTNVTEPTSLATSFVL